MRRSTALAGTPRAATRAAPRTTIPAVTSAAILAAALLAAALALAPGDARAASSAVELESPRIDSGNEKSLQRGARAFVNYCMGCHSAGYARYSRVARDLGLSEEDVENNLILTTDESGEPTKVGALMDNAMTREYGESAFGVAPPNLALTARSRGTDWIYTFLKTFYVDPERAGTGVNNLVYPGTAMPHVLWPLQGWQTLEHTEGEEGGDHGGAAALTLAEPGSLSPDQYDDLIGDITNFLAYLSDPVKQTRQTIGIFVMLFLFVLLGVAYFLKKEYWKDVV